MNLRTLACLAVLGASTAATAQNTATLPYGPGLTLEDARTCAAAVRAAAVKNDWLMVVTVVDSGGHVVLTERMDNARSARFSRRSTRPRGRSPSGGRPRSSRT